MRQTQTAVALVAAMLLCVACSTLYKATCTITQVVDDGMRTWADLSVAGKTSTVIDAKVVQAHNRYREACGVAATALEAYKASGDQTQYIAALNAVRAAAQSIFDIITPLLSQAKAETFQEALKKASTI